MRPGTELTPEVIRNGSTTLLTAFAKAQNPSVDTIVYTDAEPAGIEKSCTDAYTDINNKFTTVDGSDAFKSIKMGACSDAGYSVFDVDVSKAAIAYGECVANTNGLLASISGGWTLDKFVAEMYIVNSFWQTISKDNPAAFSNTKTAKRSMSALQEYLATMGQKRGLITALAAAMIPFLGLFLPTKYWSMVLSMLVTAFAIGPIWGTLDAILTDFYLSNALATWDSFLGGASGAANWGVDTQALWADDAMKQMANWGLYVAASFGIALTVAMRIGGGFGAVVGGFAGAAATSSEGALDKGRTGAGAMARETVATGAGLADATVGQVRGMGLADSMVNFDGRSYGDLEERRNSGAWNAAQRIMSGNTPEQVLQQTTDSNTGTHYGGAAKGEAIRNAAGQAGISEAQAGLGLGTGGLGYMSTPNGTGGMDEQLTNAGVRKMTQQGANFATTSVQSSTGAVMRTVDSTDGVAIVNTGGGENPVDQVSLKNSTTSGVVGQRRSAAEVASNEIVSSMNKSKLTANSVEYLTSLGFTKIDATAISNRFTDATGTSISQAYSQRKINTEGTSKDATAGAKVEVRAGTPKALPVSAGGSVYGSVSASKTTSEQNVIDASLTGANSQTSSHSHDRVLSSIIASTISNSTNTKLAETISTNLQMADSAKIAQSFSKENSAGGSVSTNFDTYMVNDLLKNDTRFQSEGMEGNIANAMRYLNGNSAEAQAYKTAALGNFMNEYEVGRNVDTKIEQGKGGLGTPGAFNHQQNVRELKDAPENQVGSRKSTGKMETMPGNPTTSPSPNNGGGKIPLRDRFENIKDETERLASEQKLTPRFGVHQSPEDTNVRSFIPRQ